MTSTDVLLNFALPGSSTQTTALAFADVMVDGHRETWPLRSKRFSA